MWYRVALNSIGDGVIVINRYGRIGFMNPAAKAITGWTSNGYGMELPEVLCLMDETTQRTIEDPFTTVMRDGTFGAAQDRWVLARHDGTEVSIAVTGTQVLDEKEVADGVILIIRDAENRIGRLKQPEMLNARSLIRYQEQLRSMAAVQLLTEQRERRRLASDIHNSLAHTLVACRMHARRLSNSVSDTQRGGIINALDDMLSQSIHYTRTLMSDLCPVTLYEKGFEAAVFWLADRMKRHDLAVTVRMKTSQALLAGDQAVLAYQAVRELLTNVLKHAQVDQAEIDIEQRNGDLQIVVSDHGVGFTPMTGRWTTDDGHFGLFSIDEHIQTLGGRFTMTSTPGGGSQAVLQIPVHNGRMNEPFATKMISASPKGASDRIESQES